MELDEQNGNLTFFRKIVEIETVRLLVNSLILKLHSSGLGYALCECGGGLHCEKN